MIKLILTTDGIFQRFTEWYCKYKRLSYPELNEHTITCPIRLSGWLSTHPNTSNTNYAEVFISIEHYLHITETLDEYNNQGV